MPPLRGEVRSCKSRRVGVRREEKKEKKHVTWRWREAFAMMDALAWQATVIKKIFLCPGEEFARGFIYFLAPGSPPPMCPCARSFPFCAAIGRPHASSIAALRQSRGATAEFPRENCCIVGSTVVDHVEESALKCM